MQLLRDADLIANLTLPEPQNPNDPDSRYIIGLTLPDTDARRYSKDSPVQASSVDLHIGEVYLPGAKEAAPGTATTRPDYVLKTGETAVVTTLETVNLPDYVAAIGFPPSRVSFKGLLMTNPGHVDPGYKGKLRFTVINMSKEPYPLNSGAPIVSLLLFQWEMPNGANWPSHPAQSGGVHAHWRTRNAVAQGAAPAQREINRLAKDFVNVEKRAKDIANAQGVKWTVVLTVAASLLAALLTLLAGGFAKSKDVQEIQTKQAVLETKQAALEKNGDVSQKLQELDKRIKDLERIQKK